MPIVLVLKGSPAGYLLVVRFVWALCAAPFIKYLGFCLWICFPAPGSPPLFAQRHCGVLTHFPSLTPTTARPRARLERLAEEANALT